MNYTIEPWITKELNPEFLEVLNEIISLELNLAATEEEELKLWDPFERYYILWSALKQIAHVQGDYVQCGVYRGEEAFYMAKQCKTTLHLFDSFEKVVAEDLIECDNEYYLENPYKCDVTEPETVLKQFDNVKINVGKVPANFDTVQNIAFLYIDLNLYTSTKIALNELWPKIVSGGMAFIDLHDSYSSGAEVAVKEFFESLGIDVQMLPTGIVVVYKP
jgi:hypothetical protein